MFVKVGEKSGNNFSFRKASFKMIDVDTLRVSDACCSFGRWFVFFFIIRQANLTEASENCSEVSEKSGNVLDSD